MDQHFVDLDRYYVDIYVTDMSVDRDDPDRLLKYAYIYMYAYICMHI